MKADVDNKISVFVYHVGQRNMGAGNVHLWLSDWTFLSPMPFHPRVRIPKVERFFGSREGLRADTIVSRSMTKY